MEIKVINKSDYPLPEYKTEYSAGMDLRANLEASFVLAPHKRVLIPTGIFISLPIGYEGQVRPRSGLAAKFGITILNSPGTIDADYRGEIHACLYNTSDEEFVINPGDRIAQLVIAKHERVDWIEVTELDETERGTRGHGSTGIN